MFRAALTNSLRVWSDLRPRHTLREGLYYLLISVLIISSLKWREEYLKIWRTSLVERVNGPEFGSELIFHRKELNPQLQWGIGTCLYTLQCSAIGLDWDINKPGKTTSHACRISPSLAWLGEKTISADTTDAIIIEVRY